MTQGSTRRTVLATGAAALAAAGCGSNSSTEISEASPSPETASPQTSPLAKRDPASPSPAGRELARTSDIPEGGGMIFAAQKVVVTQPKKGEFKAFSAICTHENCAVSTVANGTIDCPCHGSRFRIADGSVANGPAIRPLPPEQIKVEGNSIRLT